MPRHGQFGATALAMLGMLERCPWLPADVLEMLVGVRNPRSLARSLLRLREAGLVASRRARLGRLLAGGRPVTLWTATAAGLAVLPASVAGPSGEAGCPDRRARGWQGATLDLVILVASYRLLSRTVGMFAATGEPVRVRAWEAAWVRHDSAGRRVAFPAGATLETGGARSLALLLPDLGTAPVGRARPAVGRLLRLLEEQAARGTPLETTPLVVIGCPDPDGTGGRERAWRELVARAAQRAGMI